jgi:hypothetical protein
MAKSSRSPQARVLSSRIAYKGPVFSVTTDEVAEPGGVRARRDVIRHSGSIVILAVDDGTLMDLATSNQRSPRKKIPGENTGLRNLAFFSSASIAMPPNP